MSSFGVQNASLAGLRHVAAFAVLRVNPEDTVRMAPAIATSRMAAAPATQAAPNPAQAPEWVADVRRKYTLRITDWVTQAWAMTHSPRRFMEEWATGKREALNPLRFLAVGTALSLVTQRAARWFLHSGEPAASPSSLLGQTSIGITVMLFVLGFMLHAVLRFRSRAPLRCTVAAMIFSTGGPGALLSVLGWFSSIGIYVVRHRVPSLEGTPIPVLVSSALASAWWVAALAGVHRVRWWWALLAMLAVPVGCGLVGLSVGAAVGIGGRVLSSFAWTG